MKYYLLLFSLFAALLIYASVKYPHGIVGTTKLNGEGCTCHNADSDSLVKVWIEGPDTLTIGQSANYKLFLTGGPKVSGGFNVAAFLGSLASVDSFSRIIDAELTHAFPKPFNLQDTIDWVFNYTAASNRGYDTIYSVAQSVNGDEIPSDEDKWNFGKNFVVTIVPPVKIVTDSKISLSEFELMQNYPNPFNPSTRIKFSLPVSQKVSLEVFDMLGNNVATLVDEYKLAGNYEVEFSAKNGLASGVYYYRLVVGNYSQTKKMILMR